MSDVTEILPDLLALSNAKEQLWKFYEHTIDMAISLSPSVLYGFLLSDIQKGLCFFSPYMEPNADTGAAKNRKMQLKIVEKGQTIGEIKPGDPASMVQTFIAALVGIAIAWSSNGGQFDEKSELRKAFDIIF